MNRTRFHFYHTPNKLDLRHYLEMPAEFVNSKIKCRIIYSKDILSVEYIPYIQRNITSLKIIREDRIDYSFKYQDRHFLDQLYQKREAADDILIIKNNLITDTSFSNLVFLKKGKWYTPALPLLEGTAREHYIFQKKIYPASISPDDLHQYEVARLINSMIQLEEANSISIDEIK